MILHEDHRTPTVTVNVWYHVGSKDEAPHRNGFAHLFEHLMFQGSRNVPEDTFFLNLERAGGSGINGTTNTDRTNYFETVPSGRLNLALWLESDRMAFLLDHVNQATFESQREVVLNERRQNYENAPYGQVIRFIHEAAYPESHPYHRLTIGTPEDLNQASLEDVRNFFRTWYVPNNATLVVAGDFEPAATRAMVQQYFEPIVRGADPPRQTAPAAVQMQSEVRLNAEAGVAAGRVYIAWHSPNWGQPGDAALDEVAALLTEGRSSRLQLQLVHQQQIAQEIDATQWSREYGSLFLIVGTARSGHTPQELLTAIDTELQRIRDTAPTADELDRARTHHMSGLLFGVERVGGRADLLNFYNHYAGNPDFLSQDMARYQGLAAPDLQAAVRDILRNDRRVVVMVDANPAAPVSGRLRENQ